MKKIVCEICGKTEFSKNGESYVCKGCGTSFTKEDINKMTIDDGVENSSTNVGNLLNKPAGEAIGEIIGKNKKLFGIIVALLIVGGIMLFFINNANADLNNRERENAERQAAAQAAAAEREAKEQAKTDAAKKMADKVITDVKKGLVNPHSFEVLEDVQVVMNEKEAYVEITFSAANSLGGTVEGKVYGAVYSDGDVSSVCEVSNDSLDAIEMTIRSSCFNLRSSITSGSDYQRLSVSKDLF